ncbi:MAG: tetratricopeptide repeat protein [Bacteroidia bacterium]
MNLIFINRFASALILFSILALSYPSRLRADNIKGNKSWSEFYLNLSENYVNTNLDSALYWGLKAEASLKSEKSDSIKIAVYLNNGEVYSALGNADTSFEYFLMARRLNDSLREKDLEDRALKLQEANIILRIGTLKFRVHDYTASLKHYEEALKILEDLYAEKSEANLAARKAAAYNNIAGIYLQQGDFDTALIYYKNALEANEVNKNVLYESSISNNIGICYLEKKDYDLADHYFLKSLAIRKNDGDKRGQAQCLNSLGKNQIMQGRFNASLSYFEQALALGKEIRHAESMLISLESLSNLNDTLGRHKQAFQALKEFKQLSDSVFSADSKIEMAKLESDYSVEKERKMAQLEEERNKAIEDRKEIRNYTILGGLFFLLLTAILLLFLMRGKVRNSKLEQEKLKLESEKLELERITLQENLEFKNRELTSKALFLMKNNELISSIAEKLIEAKSAFKLENQKIIQEIIHELRASQDAHVWDEFETHFTQVHSDFYKKLQDQFPNLSANEKKLCAFLRLNLSTKEISAITYQSINSITVARSRLRKKMNLEGEDTQLVNFLMQI